MTLYVLSLTECFYNHIDGGFRFLLGRDINVKQMFLELNISINTDSAL